MTAIPEIAEKFPVLDWFKVERVPSKYVPGRNAMVSKLQCPGCQKLHESPGIDTTLVCECGLSLQYGMAHLHVWRAEPAAVA